MFSNSPAIPQAPQFYCEAFNEAYLTAETTMAVDKERDAFNQLAREKGLSLDEQDFLHYCKLLAFITQCPRKKTNAAQFREQAMRLTAVFSTFKEAVAYLARFENWADVQASWGYIRIPVDENNLIAQACNFSLPENGADLALWRDLVRRHSPNHGQSPVLKLLPYAMKLEKDMDPKANTLTELLQCASGYVWPEKAAQNPVLARLFFELNVPNSATVWDLTPKTQSFIPDAMLMGREILDKKGISNEYENYYICSLDPADPRAFVLRALICGDPYLSQSHVKNNAKNGITNPNCGFYVLCKKMSDKIDLKNDPICAYTEVWRGTKEEIVMKEVYGYPSFMDQHSKMAADFFICLSEKLVREYGVPCVLTHKKGSEETRSYDKDKDSFFYRASAFTTFADTVPVSYNMNMSELDRLSVIAMKGAPSFHYTEGKSAVIPDDADEQSLLAYIDLYLSNDKSLPETQQRQLERYGLSIDKRAELNNKWLEFLQTCNDKRSIDCYQLKEFISQKVNLYTFLPNCNDSILSLAIKTSDVVAIQIIMNALPGDTFLTQAAFEVLARAWEKRHKRHFALKLNNELCLHFCKYLQTDCPKELVPNALLIPFALKAQARDALTKEEAWLFIGNAVDALIESKHNFGDLIDEFEYSRLSIIEFLAKKNIAYAQHKLSDIYLLKARTAKGDKATLYRLQGINYWSMADAQGLKTSIAQYYQIIYPFNEKAPPNMLCIEAQAVIHDIMVAWKDLEGYQLICSQEFQEKQTEINQCKQIMAQLTNKQNTNFINSCIQLKDKIVLLKAYRDRLSELRQHYSEYEISISVSPEKTYLQTMWKDNLLPYFKDQINTTAINLTIHCLSEKIELQQQTTQNNGLILEALKEQVTLSKQLLKQKKLTSGIFEKIAPELINKRDQAEKSLEQEISKASDLLAAENIPALPVLLTQTKLLIRRYKDYETAGKLIPQDILDRCLRDYHTINQLKVFFNQYQALEQVLGLPQLGELDYQTDPCNEPFKREGAREMVDKQSQRADKLSQEFINYATQLVDWLENQQQEMNAIKQTCAQLPHTQLASSEKEAIQNEIAATTKKLAEFQTQIKSEMGNSIPCYSAFVQPMAIFGESYSQLLSKPNYVKLRYELYAEKVKTKIREHNQLIMLHHFLNYTQWQLNELNSKLNPHHLKNNSEAPISLDEIQFPHHLATNALDSWCTEQLSALMDLRMDIAKNLAAIEHVLNQDIFAKLFAHLDKEIALLDNKSNTDPALANKLHSLCAKKKKIGKKVASRANEIEEFSDEVSSKTEIQTVLENEIRSSIGFFKLDAEGYVSGKNLFTEEELSEVKNGLTEQMEQITEVLQLLGDFQQLKQDYENSAVPLAQKTLAQKPKKITPANIPQDRLPPKQVKLPDVELTEIKLPQAKKRIKPPIPLPQTPNAAPLLKQDFTTNTTELNTPLQQGLSKEVDAKLISDTHLAASRLTSEADQVLKDTFVLRDEAASTLETSLPDVTPDINMIGSVDIPGLSDQRFEANATIKMPTSLPNLAEFIEQAEVLFPAEVTHLPPVVSVDKENHGQDKGMASTSHIVLPEEQTANTFEPPATPFIQNDNAIDTIGAAIIPDHLTPDILIATAPSEENQLQQSQELEISLGSVEADTEADIAFAPVADEKPFPEDNKATVHISYGPVIPAYNTTILEPIVEQYDDWDDDVPVAVASDKSHQKVNTRTKQNKNTAIVTYTNTAAIAQQIISRPCLLVPSLLVSSNVYNPAFENLACTYFQPSYQATNVSFAEMPADYSNHLNKNNTIAALSDEEWSDEEWDKECDNVIPPADEKTFEKPTTLAVNNGIHALCIEERAIAPQVRPNTSEPAKSAYWNAIENALADIKINERKEEKIATVADLLKTEKLALENIINKFKQQKKNVNSRIKEFIGLGETKLLAPLNKATHKNPWMRFRTWLSKKWPSTFKTPSHPSKDLIYLQGSLESIVRYKWVLERITDIHSLPPLKQLKQTEEEIKSVLTAEKDKKNSKNISGIFQGLYYMVTSSFQDHSLQEKEDEKNRVDDFFNYMTTLGDTTSLFEVWQDPLSLAALQSGENCIQAIEKNNYQPASQTREVIKPVNLWKREPIDNKVFADNSPTHFNRRGVAPVPAVIEPTYTSALKR